MVADDPQTPEDVDAGPSPELLQTPRDGTPRPLTTAAEIADAASRIAAGHGPIAIDAERASGYRYSQRAYLIQLRRHGCGTVLIDPIDLSPVDFAPLQAAIGDAEWIVHAASQDLPCLAELGLRPARLFDTELIGRLLGSERVALGTMVTQYLNFALEKGHSAADWSQRPLPDAWLDYAALDVELLIELRDILQAELERTGKVEWAEQECAAVLNAPPPPPRVDPWRRTSGLHGVRNRRQLAIVRHLWEARDAMAERRDISPGRVLPDAAIIAAAKAAPTSVEALLAVPVFNGPRQRRNAEYWMRAIAKALALPDADLPPVSNMVVDADFMPSPSRWAERDPAAAVRLAAVKQVISDVAEERAVVSQNLLAGDVQRRLAWRGVEPVTPDTVRARLLDLGARPWQADVLAPRLAEALETAARQSAPEVAEPASEGPSQGAE